MTVQERFLGTFYRTCLSATLTISAFVLPANAQMVKVDTRQAVNAFRASERDWLEQGFGLWTRYGRGIDGAEFERATRTEWSDHAGGPAA